MLNCGDEAPTLQNIYHPHNLPPLLAKRSIIGNLNTNGQGFNSVSPKSEKIFDNQEALLH